MTQNHEQVVLDETVDGSSTPELWPTFAARRETIERAPDATIAPQWATPGTRERRAVAALVELGAGSGSVDLELGATIGVGGMGIVRAAEQFSIGRTVAVKTLKEGIGGTQATQTLLREAWTTGRLEHPNIVPIYDVRVDEAGRPRIVLRKIVAPCSRPSGRC